MKQKRLLEMIKKAYEETGKIDSLSQAAIFGYAVERCLLATENHDGSVSYPFYLKRNNNAMCRAEDIMDKVVKNV